MFGHSRNHLTQDNGPIGPLIIGWKVMCEIRTKFGPNFQGGMVFSGPNTIFWSKMYDLNPDQLEPFQGRCVRDPDQRGLGGRPPLRVFSYV